MSLYTGLQLAADQKLAGLIVMSGIILINISVNNVCLCFFLILIYNMYIYHWYIL